MLILEKPYVSEFLIETVKKNNFCVLDNEISRKYLSEKYLVSDKDAVKLYLDKNEPVYTNSENALNWIDKNLPNSPLNKLIKLSKDKVKFRSALKEIYPDYFFKEVTKDELKTVDVSFLKFPLVLKPSVGFLSFGVYGTENEKSWKNITERIDEDIKKFENIFPQNVVNTSKFIIEEMIEGDEYALDAYFNHNGEAVILNIFHHPFSDNNDVSDRIYYTNKEIMLSYLDKFK